MEDGRTAVRGRTLSEALGLKAKEMISLTGAGGKTTLMYRLAQELVLQGKRVITTTTTKILKPRHHESPHLFLSKDGGRIVEFVTHTLSLYGHLTLAQEEISEGKLKGIPPEWADHLWHGCEMDALIIEADGAKGRPVKAPRDGEPVIPKETTLVVALLGMDGVGKELNEQHIFQPQRVSRLTGIREDEKMTEEGMALLMIHPKGLFKGAPDSSRRIAFLNKVDDQKDLARAQKIGQIILNEKKVSIERIILSRLKGEQPIIEVLMP